jgi:uncharacterized membrane protein YfcA
MTELAQLSPWIWLVAPLAIVFAYTIFGISGFGSTIIAVPILAHFLPVTFLVPMMVLLDLPAAIFVGTKDREKVSRFEMKHLLPFMFVGIVLGVTVLVKVPEAWLRAAMGVFAAAVGINSIVNPVLHRTISRWWCVPAGILAGAMAAIFGAGGPIHATYLSGRLRDKGELRATMAAIISISAFARALVYAASGLLLNAAIFVAMLLLSPFVWVGLWIGGRIHVGLSQQQLRRVIGALLVLTGLTLLARTFL